MALPAPSTSARAGRATPKPDEPSGKARVRAAAAKLFREHGYEQATVRDIAKAVGLQSGSLFHHYATKEEILVDVMLEGLRLFSDAAKAALAGASSPRGRLRALFEGHLNALHARDRDEVAVVLSEWRSLSPKSRRQIVKRRDEVDAAWDAALREAAAAGLVGGDPRLLRLAMLGALNWSLQWYDARGPLAIDALAGRMLAIFVPGDEVPNAP